MFTDLARHDAVCPVDRKVPLAGRDDATGRNSDHGPDGPSALSRLSPIRRSWDARLWPHATKAFGLP